MAEPADCEATDARLAAILEEFERRRQAGDDPDPGEVLARNPGVAGLAECLQGMAAIEELRGALSSDDSAPAPKRIAEYDLLREIGRGGMGVVYEAEDRQLGRRVALKMIKTPDLAGPEEVQRFQAEAQAIASLQHPHIVQIFEVGNSAGRWFLVLEYVAGGSLADKLARAVLQPIQAARLVETLARAMDFAHQRHIVHRDLKPANVLLMPEGTPKITDFGLAKRLDSLSGRTHTGAVLGTPSYMAPEQAAGSPRDISPATDVYALGAILYECLTGRPPFKAATAFATLTQIKTEEPVPPRRLQPSVPVDLQTICLKCLAKEPRRRYAKALHLAEDLGRFAAGEPILARPVGWGERSWRWCRRHPAVAGLSGAFVVLVVAVVALLVQRFADAAAAQARQTGRREEIMDGTVYDASGAASRVLDQFRHLAGAVESIAEAPELSPLLAGKEQKKLQQYFEETYRSYAKRADFAQPDGTCDFQSFHVLDADGILLADAPAVFSVVGKDFSGRDYFQGALRRAHALGRNQSRVHVSRVYVSENDGLSKIALSIAVLEDGNPKGRVLGVLAATLTTTSTLGNLILHDKRRKAVLVGRLDPNPPRGPPAASPKEEFVILLHPAYEHGTKAVALPSENLPAGWQPSAGGELRAAPASLDRDQAMNADYRDPVADRHAEYQGRWLAGFAPVGNSGLFIIVQQRDPVAAAQAATVDLVLMFLAGLAVLLALAGYWLWLRQRQDQGPAGSSAESEPTIAYEIKSRGDSQREADHFPGPGNSR